MCCVSGPLRGAGVVSENVLSSGGRAGAGRGAGQCDSLKSSSQNTCTPPG